MAVFRVERNTGYTVMSNHHLRNKELSLKAKGLLSQMLSLPEDWDYTLAGLSHINREKIDAIREAVSSSDKERIQHQYDALAKKTLVGEAKSHRRTLAKRAAREVTFSDLSESELAQLFTTDEYESDYFRFQVSGFDVLVLSLIHI